MIDRLKGRGYTFLLVLLAFGWIVLIFLAALRFNTIWLAGPWFIAQALALVPLARRLPLKPVQQTQAALPSTPRRRLPVKLAIFIGAVLVLLVLWGLFVLSEGYLFQEGPFSPGNQILRFLAIAGLAVAASLLAFLTAFFFIRGLSIQELRSLGWLGWRGLALGGLVIAGALSELLAQPEYLPYIQIGLLVLLIIFTARPIRLACQESRLLVCTLASTLFLFMMAIWFYIISVSIFADWVIATIQYVVIAEVALLFLAGFWYGITRFTGIEVVHNSGLINWRGAFLLSILLLGAVIYTGNVYPSFLSVSALIPISLVFAMAILILYWQPTKSWRANPAPLYFLGSLAAVFGALLAISLLSFAILASSKIALPIITIALVSFPILCGLLLLLTMPWLHDFIETSLPRLIPWLASWKTLAFLIGIAFTIGVSFFFFQADWITYYLMVILIGGACVVGMKTLLQPLSLKGWAIFMACILAPLASAVLITAHLWIENWLYANVPSSLGVMGLLFAIMTALPILLAMCLGILANRSHLWRVMAALIILEYIATFVLLEPRRIGDTGITTGYVWLALFAIGWLLAPLLSSRIETWEATAWSGLILLSLSPLLLPIFFRESELVTYRLSLPIWASQHLSELPWIGLVAGVLFIICGMSFAILLRSGQAALLKSRQARSEALLTGVLVLGACLILSSSYRSKTQSKINLLSGQFWANVVLPQGAVVQPTFLFADADRRIWIGTDLGDIVRFQGEEHTTLHSGDPGLDGPVSKIFSDSDGYTWVVADRTIRAYAEGSDKPETSLRPQSMGLAEDRPGKFNDILMDSRHDLWLATDKGLYYAPWTGNIHDTFESLTKINNNYTANIREDQDGHIGYISLGSNGWSFKLMPYRLDEQILNIDPDGSVVIPLDLFPYTQSQSVKISLAVYAPEATTLTLDVSTDQGSTWQCQESSSSSYKQNFTQQAAGCQSTVSGSNAIPLVTDLSAYAGKGVLFRLSNPSSDEKPAPFKLLQAYLHTQDQAVRITSDRWIGNALVQPVQPQPGIGILESANLVSDQEFSIFSQPFLTYYNNRTGERFGANLIPLDEGGKPNIPASSLAFQDAEGRIWLTPEGNDLVYTQNWTDLVAVSQQGLKIDHVSTMTESGKKIWIAGQADFSTLEGNKRRYVVASFEPDSQAERLYNSADHGLAVGEARMIVVDSSSDPWVLIENRTYIPNSIWWYLIPALVLVGITWNEYYQQPPSQAVRLARRLRLNPGSALEELYGVLHNNPAAGDVLVHLGRSSPSSKRQDWQDLAQALEMIAPDRPLPTSDYLNSFAELLAKAASYTNEPGQTPDGVHAVWVGAPGLCVFYHYLVEASCSETVANIAAWRLQVLRPDTNSPAMFTSDTIQPIEAPSFVNVKALDLLESMGDVSNMLRKYAQVESSQDRLLFLANSLSTSERALRSAGAVTPPEGSLLRSVILDWIEIIQAELNTFSGSAELRLELLTRQLRRSDQMTLALRLENTGRAVAENLQITLEPGPGFDLPGVNLVKFDSLSAGAPQTVEFQITPGEQPDVRIACHVTWDDRTGKGRSTHFADMLRFYSTSEEFRRIPNPYIVGLPVKTESMFQGRQDIFKFIVDNLTGTVQERALVIHGQRRTGKTSILYQLAGGKLGENFLPVMIDMQALALSVNSTADLLSEIAYQIYRVAHKAGLQIEEPAVESFTAAPSRTFDRFLDTLEDILQNKRAVLMFDEFEELETKISAGKLEVELLGYFRSLMQHGKGLVFIFTGTHRLDELSHDYWSVFFNIAINLRISFLTREETVKLICDPVQGMLDVDELAIEKIVQLTHGHPYFTQLLCWALVNYCNQKERNYASINDVNDALDDIIINGEAHFAFIWQQAKDLERLTLAGLAHAMRAGREWVTPNEILDTLMASGAVHISRNELLESLDRLVRQESLSQSTEGALSYRFQIDILQQWIVKTKSIAALMERRP